MPAFKKILVPTDFSEGSEAALRYACRLAEALDAPLCLLHTVENPYPVGGYPDYYSLEQEYLERLEHEARKNLAAALTPDEKNKCRATLVLRHGIPAQQILMYLHEQGDIDLVIMATHGRGGVARLMMGSVADKVVRAAPCPVLTLREPEVEEPRTSRAA